MFAPLLPVLAAASATAVAATAPNKIKLGRGLRRGDAMTKALLKKARPYGKQSRGGRRLEQEEIDGSYGLKFSQCVEVKTADENLFDENIVDYAKAGQVVAAKSYVLFHLCKGDYCYYDSDDDLYMVDLPTYLASIGTYHANKRQDYCQQCEQFADHCNAYAEEEEDDEAAAEESDADEDEANEDEGEEEQAAEQDEDAEDEMEGENQEEQGEDGEEDQDKENQDQEGAEGEEEGKDGEEGQGEGDRRRLTESKHSKKIERKLADKTYIDCGQCQTYECFVDEEDLDDNAQTQENIDNKVSQWIEELAGCQETGDQWNGIDVYTSAICSPYGDGIELAAFADEECSLYVNELAFQDVTQNYEDDIDYLTLAEYYIKTAFSEEISCLKQEFDDPDEEENEEEENEEEVNYELNDYCQGILEGELVDFNNCEADDAQEDEEENENEWYSYDIAEADDVNQVCAVVNQMGGEFSYVYSEEGSGTWYQRDSSGAIVTGDEQQPLITLSPAIIAGIVAGVIVVLSMLCYCARPKKTNHDITEEPVYQGGKMS